jgi:hypothetical protein
MIYWALGPFVRSFTLPVDPGDICPPQRGDLVELFCGLLGVAAFVLHPPCLDHSHLPLDHCRHLEVAHLLDFLFHQLELHPHFESVEMLAWRRMVDLVHLEALRIP